MKNRRKCNGCDVTDYNINENFKCAKCGFEHKVLKNEDELKSIVEEKLKRIRKR